MRLSLASRCGLPMGLLFMKNSVLVGPGAMALTVIPNGVSSSDQTRAKFESIALVPA